MRRQGFGYTKAFVGAPKPFGLWDSQLSLYGGYRQNPRWIDGKGSLRSGTLSQLRAGTGSTKTGDKVYDKVGRESAAISRRPAMIA